MIFRSLRIATNCNASALAFHDAVQDDCAAVIIDVLCSEMLAKMHALTSLQRSSMSSSLLTTGMLRSLAAALLQSQAGLACTDTGRRITAPVTKLQTSCSLPATLNQSLDVRVKASMHSLITSAGTSDWLVSSQKFIT